MLSKYFKSFAQNITIYFLGVFSALFFILFLALSLPIYLYRRIITKIAAPLFSEQNIKEPVCLVGQAFAMELFKKPGEKCAPRSTITVSFVIDRPASLEEVYETIDKNWIKAQKPHSTKLKYPELQQYITSWMGFLFWKQDEHFQLRNHLKLHVIDENSSDLDSDSFLNQLNEKLLNMSYIPERSPWEMHLLQNYKNAEICPGNLSAIIFRVHHSMADGYSLLDLLVEGLFGNDIENARVAKPSSETNEGVGLGFLNTLQNIYSSMVYPLGFIYELGRFASFSFKKKSLYYIPDEKKRWNQMFVKAPPYHMNKIKFIKSSFGVSFATVLNSALAAGLGKILLKLMENAACSEKVGLISSPSYLVFAATAPKPNHPRKLTVHSFLVAFEVPIKPELDALKRLQVCEQRLQQVVESPLPLISGILLDMFSGHSACVARFLMKNRFFPAGVTNFPGPGVALNWNGKKIIDGNFAAGGMDGLAGVGFMVSSFVDKVHVCATAESGVMSKIELEELMSYVCEELDSLYDLALRTSQENI